MIIYLSLAICLIGLVIYLTADPQKPKLVHIGDVMFWTGLLAFLLQSRFIDILR